MVLEQNLWPCMAVFGYYGRVLQYIAAYCSISQYIAAYRSILQYIAVFCSISQYIVVHRSILHFLAVIDPNSFGLVKVIHCLFMRFCQPLSMLFDHCAEWDLFFFFCPPNFGHLVFFQVQIRANSKPDPGKWVSAEYFYILHLAIFKSNCLLNFVYKQGNRNSVNETSQSSGLKFRDVIGSKYKQS